MNNWFLGFFTSSIGRKLLMALSGLFLILFLAIHLAGNLQLLQNDGGVAFNKYSAFMGHNPFIQLVSKGNFAFIILHAVVGLMLWVKNKTARGAQGYAVVKTRATQTNPTFAKFMWLYGIIMLVFIIIHLVQFWAVMKFGEVGTAVQLVDIEGEQVRDLYSLVGAAFTNLGFVVFYVMSMVVIAFHLWHGFQSAFQTLGWNHPKYTPIIQVLGKAYSVLVPLGFAVIPIVFYLLHS
ncbi:MAG: succinate dehydrogenase cytochrome b subunit [Saprospiraceae bacterium]|nr:succinate dehydrogenase cytochrome b subunit [Saprospiraceae bacterium]